MWLTDITEHPTREGKLYLCAVKDVWLGRVGGYSISDRMKTAWPLTPSAWLWPAAVRWRAASCTRTGDPNSVPARSWPSCVVMTWSAPWDGSVLPVTTPPVLLRPAAEERPQPGQLALPPRTPAGDHHLDRADLPPPPTPTPPGTFDAHRVRDHHDHTGHPGRLTQTCHQDVQQSRLF